MPIKASDIYYNGATVVPLETVICSLSDLVTPVGTGTGVEYLTLRYNLTLNAVWFEIVAQAPSGSAAIVRALADTGSGFSNLFTSADALTISADSQSVGPLVPNTTFLPVGTVLRFDIQQVGAVDTGLGYRVTLQGTRS